MRNSNNLIENTSYEEKGNFKIRKKCENFIHENFDVHNNIKVHSEAIKLSSKLIGSLLRSQRFFDRKVAFESVGINQLDDIDLDIAIFKFNNKNISLVLDKASHDVLDKMEIIIKNN